MTEHESAPQQDATLVPVAPKASFGAAVVESPTTPVGPGLHPEKIVPGFAKLSRLPDAPQVHPSHAVDRTGTGSAPVPAPVQTPPAVTSQVVGPPPASPFLSASDCDEADDTTVVMNRPAPLIPWLLTTDTDETYVLAPLTLVGRKPNPRSAYPRAALLRLADPDKLLSRVHAVIDYNEDGICLTDLGSTNGTALITAQGTAYCEPNVRYLLDEVLAIDFGGARCTLRRADR
ncbi:FHA domain-containing protein [Leucobacter sp. cx-42]|uniref:FHA domain-containing protein n=1 Tax=unclassified Leucobacter TaxID=2621730 RepID=UPI00165EA89D|nr:MULTISPECIES: FHA domain-containing protein [unclassified Leucobacter]MBC9953661.1 FHA domain-containing protein [Leucobacter sp. cx-42]